MTELILTGVHQIRTDDPKHYRVVCRIKGGGKLAIWGRDGNTANVALVQSWIRDFGFPLTVSCVWTAPAFWAAERSSHTRQQ